MAEASPIPVSLPATVPGLPRPMDSDPAGAAVLSGLPFALLLLERISARGAEPTEAMSGGAPDREGGNLLPLALPAGTPFAGGPAEGEPASGLLQLPRPLPRPGAEPGVADTDLRAPSPGTPSERAYAPVIAAEPTVLPGSGELRTGAPALAPMDPRSQTPASTLAEFAPELLSSHAIRQVAEPPGMPRPAAAASPPLPVAFGEPGWGEALASRVVWQTGGGTQHASLRLDPPELGPVEVRVSVKHDQAHVQFSAQHGVVREAIEDAIPRLRELLAQSGLNLADVNVSQHSGGQGRGPFAGEAGTGPETLAAEPPADDPGSIVTTIREQTGLVDEYA